MFPIIDKVRSRNMYETMKVQLAGEGRPILAIPGTTGNHQVFDQLITPLQDEFQIIAIDHPNDCDIKQYLSQLHEIVERYDIKICIGTSVGGYITQLYQSRYGTLEYLILSNTFHDPRINQDQNKWMYLFVKVLPWRLIKFLLHRQISSEMPDSTTGEQLLGILQVNLDTISKSEFINRLEWTMKSSDIPNSISQPILQITTKNDPVISASQSTTLNQYHKNITHVELDEGGHFPYFLKAEKVATHIRSFLL